MINHDHPIFHMITPFASHEISPLNPSIIPWNPLKSHETTRFFENCIVRWRSHSVPAAEYRDGATLLAKISSDAARPLPSKLWKAEGMLRELGQNHRFFVVKTMPFLPPMTGNGFCCTYLWWNLALLLFYQHYKEAYLLDPMMNYNTNATNVDFWYTTV